MHKFMYKWTRVCPKTTTKTTGGWGAASLEYGGITAIANPHAKRGDYGI
jgi:hypothetical protein